ncbi:MAG: acyltransferase domain-containing protein, partial [Frankia sp.]
DSAAAAPVHATFGPGRLAELPPDPTTERILLLCGATPADIARQLDVPDEDLLARDDAAQAPTGGPARLAIVAPTKRRLSLARSVAARGTAWRGRNDLWFTPAPLLGNAAVAGPRGADGTPGPDRRGTVAFLFCGLEDKFEPRVEDVCAHFGLPLPGIGDAGGLGQHGVASVEVGRVLDRALRILGITPDHFGGHSIGEWNAMISSGMITDEAADGFIAGFDPNSLQIPGVVFGALGCGAEKAAAAIDGLPEVVVSHDNCPHQSIICGQEPSVRTALERLRAQGVMGQVLPFQSGFHSPFVEPYLEPARGGWEQVDLAPVSVPVWSATTVDRYPSDAAEIRALAIRHLLEPVRLRELIQRLHAEGVRVFVQVGVGSVAGFVDDTLPGTDFLTVVTNTPKRSGLDQLRRVCAALWTEGAAPRFDRLPCVHRATAPANAAAAVP